MAKLVIRPDGTKEISDVSIEEIKQLAGLNGHASHTDDVSLVKNVRQKPASILATASREPDYEAFCKAIPDRGKNFFVVLRQNPQGISGESMAERLGFSEPNQIGGLTGASLARWAKEYNVRLTKLYVKERHKLDTGDWRTTYKPGPDIDKLQ